MGKIVVGLGEALWDVFPGCKREGGAPANFAYHCGLFGHDAYVASAVGTDASGKELVNVLAHQKKLNCSAIAEVPYPTGEVIVSLSQGGTSQQYDIKQPCAWDYIPFTAVLKRLAERTDAVCFGTLAQRSPVSRETVHAFLDAMPDGAGKYKIFDVNLRQHFYTEEMLRVSLEKCNILKINETELSELEKCFRVKTPGALLEKYKLKILIVTCGGDGNYVYHSEHPDKPSFMQTPKVTVVSTVGAGDSFTAAFCSMLLNNATIEEAQARAIQVSAYVCRHSGAMPEVPVSILSGKGSCC